MAQKTFTQYLRAKESRLAPGQEPGVRRKLLVAAEEFGPGEPVYRYSMQAYPSKRGREMGLGCGIFRIEVRRNGNDIAVTARRNDGRKMGEIVALQQKTWMSGRDRDTLAVSWSSLLEGGATVEPYGVHRTRDFTRCGIGPRMYEALAKYACDRDLMMTSDTTLLDPARRFWKKQADKGRAYFDEGVQRFVIYDACRAQQTGLNGLRKKRRKG